MAGMMINFVYINIYLKVVPISTYSFFSKAALDLLTKKFARVFWTPGNHDLWTLPDPKKPQSSGFYNVGLCVSLYFDLLIVYYYQTQTELKRLRGSARYERLVKNCREYNVVTPEDPYVMWPGDGLSDSGMYFFFFPLESFIEFIFLF